MAVKIGLDAGHGLNTKGKETPNKIKEFTLNDKVCDKIISILKNYECEIIRTDNNEGYIDESLSSRLAKYKTEKVDVFVSIHHNAFGDTWNNATGVEVYVDKKATSKDMSLAQSVYDRLVQYTGLKGRGIKKENFYVINQNSIPAILVEGGFMTNTSDCKIITSKAGQDSYAKAVAEGLIEFLKLKKKPRSPIKTLDDWAKEVIAGKHGNGHTNREKSLKKSGCTYSYAKVRERVNALLK